MFSFAPSTRTSNLSNFSTTPPFISPLYLTQICIYTFLLTLNRDHWVIRLRTSCGIFTIRACSNPSQRANVVLPKNQIIGLRWAQFIGWRGDTMFIMKNGKQNVGNTGENSERWKERGVFQDVAQNLLATNKEWALLIMTVVCGGQFEKYCWEETMVA